MNPLFSIFTKDILNLIFVPLIKEGDGPTLSRVDKRFRDLIFSIMHNNASEISKNKTFIFAQFIQKRLDLNDLNSYSKCSYFFRDMVQKAHSLGGNCPKRILFPEEISKLSDQIEQVQNPNLEKIWPILLVEITKANPGIILNAPAQDANAAAIRSWLTKNSNLLQKVCSLNLQHQNLFFLPPEIGLFTSLTELYAPFNKLTSLPSEIERLTELKMLDVSDNAFTTIPPEIGKLTNLEYLLISRNKLTALPPEIGKLTKLKSLNAPYNALTTIPPEIGQLKDLINLILINNKLTTLPPEIGELTALRTLQILSNPFTELPVEIKKLKKLDHLLPPIAHLQ